MESQETVDIDFQFKDYASVIPANTWREIAGKRYYYQNYAMQKNQLDQRRKRLVLYE